MALSLMSLLFLHRLIILLCFVAASSAASPCSLLNLINEGTVADFQKAFDQNKLTSTQLTRFYLSHIRRFNPVLRGVIEVNPDALLQAKRADVDRRRGKPRGGLHGIPVLLKDNIGTKDKMNTTAGSLALVGSVVAWDAGVVARLRNAGAVFLGKASMTEWANFRGMATIPSGWCARTGQGKNPYNVSADPCGSSSGSAISVAANMGAVSLGTETADASILCPSCANAVVGIKPTLGLTSRAGLIPITPRQDTVGPICRTVADAVAVLDVIVGFDPYDANSTTEASKYIPRGGYNQFLKLDGLRGKRLGIPSNSFSYPQVFNHHFNTLRGKQGAILVDNLDLPEPMVEAYTSNWEMDAMSAEFKISLNAYLKDQLVASPVRSLADVIAFNNKHKTSEKTLEYGQTLFLDAQKTKGIDSKVKVALQNLARIDRDGFVKVMKDNKLDALVAPGAILSTILAVGGHPGIIVPATYQSNGVPFGICFGGLKGSEPTLIEIAYGFEQATKIRRPPTNIDHTMH